MTTKVIGSVSTAPKYLAAPVPTRQYANGEVTFNTDVSKANAGLRAVNSGTPGKHMPFGDVYIDATYGSTALNLAAGASITRLIEIPDIVLGDFHLISCSIDTGALTVTSRISGAGNLQVRFHNATAGTITAPSFTIYCRVYKRVL